MTETEITELNRIVSMFLDFAEDQARRRKQIFMQDWRIKTDDFLKFNDRNVLTSPGTVGREAAIQHAEAEYEIFAANRRTLREAEGEEALNHHVEDEVKKLSTRRKKKNG